VVHPGGEQRRQLARPADDAAVRRRPGSGCAGCRRDARNIREQRARDAAAPKVPIADIRRQLAEPKVGAE
jgi:hypothetical protein